MTNRTLSFAAALACAGLIACDTGADEEFETTDQEIMTQPGTETMEVEVPVEDTLLIEREVETEIDVDTTRIDGDEVPEEVGY
jgi:ferredoxin